MVSSRAVRCKSSGQELNLGQLQKSVGPWRVSKGTRELCSCTLGWARDPGTGGPPSSSSHHPVPHEQSGVSAEPAPALDFAR